MSSGDNQVTLVYNGELFNAPELRRRLAKRGCEFTSDHSDTEVLLQAYLHWGPEFVRQLNGMFAFVIYDRRHRWLFGARDQTGIKPFYYAQAGGRFAFASEVKALRPVAWIDWEIDPTGLTDYFCSQAILPPHTIHRGVRKLPAGHCFTYHLECKRLEVTRYWSPEFSLDPAQREERPDLVQRVRQEFEAAVARWTMSDVPIALSLSGGIDSAAVAAAMARQGLHPVAFSLGFRDAPELDELGLASTVAQRYGLEHRRITIDSGDLLKDLDQMLVQLDEPYAGGLPSWFVFKAMAGEFRVAMTGAGGDELFGNYRKWRLHEPGWRHWRALAAASLRGARLGELWRSPHGSTHYPFVTAGYVREEVMAADWAQGEAARSLTDRIEAGFRQPSVRTWVDRVARQDLELQLPEEFLLMTDRFSMAFSIEARTPFLDRTLMECVYAIPAKDRTESAQPKKLFLEAVHDWLPPAIVQGSKKGFVLPMTNWMRGSMRDLLRAVTAPEYLARQGMFAPALRSRVVDPFLRGDDRMRDFVWSLLMFQIWHRRVGKS